MLCCSLPCTLAALYGGCMEALSLVSCWTNATASSSSLARSLLTHRSRSCGIHIPDETNPDMIPGGTQGILCEMFASRRMPSGLAHVIFCSALIMTGMPPLKSYSRPPFQIATPSPTISPRFGYFHHPSGPNLRLVFWYSTNQ